MEGSITSGGNHYTCGEVGYGVVFVYGPDEIIIDDETALDGTAGPGSYDCKASITELELKTPYYARAFTRTTQPGTGEPITDVGEEIEFTIPVYIEDENDYGLGILIDGTWWAPVNAGYASDPGYGKLYSWGNNTGCVPPSGNPGTPGTKWEGVNNQGPCPTGWRVPTKAEYDKLLLPANSPGKGFWRAASDDNPGGMPGKWFGPNCAKIPSPSKTRPQGCVFFPAVGIWDWYWRHFDYMDVNACMWTTSPAAGVNKWCLIAAEGHAAMGSVNSNYQPASGNSVRCVHECVGTNK